MASRIFVVLAILAVMVSGTAANKHNSGKASASSKSKLCSSTFPNCRFCTGSTNLNNPVPYAYQCGSPTTNPDTWCPTNTVWDNTLQACICNSALGFGVLPWGSNCVVCANVAGGFPRLNLGLTANSGYCV